MKICVAIGIVLVIFGGLYFWWWNQPIKQLADLAMQSQVPQNWAELGNKYPQLSSTFRLLKIDPFDRSVKDPNQASQDMSQRVYVTSSRHALAGLLISVIGVVMPIVTAIRKRKKRKSEPSSAGDVATRTAPKK